MNKKISGLIRRFNTQVKQMSPDGYILQGSVISRFLTTISGGKPTPCGPYYLWTRKINNKTVTKALTKQQAQIILDAIKRNRKLDGRISDLRKISETIIFNITQSLPKRKRSDKLLI